MSDDPKQPIDSNPKPEAGAPVGQQHHQDDADGGAPVIAEITAHPNDVREPSAPETANDDATDPVNVGPDPAGPTGAAPGTAWTKHAVQLGRWAQAKLVNRADRYGVYRCFSEKKPEIYEAKATLTSSALTDHFNAVHRVGLHAIAAAGTSRWIVVDIDRHDEKVDRDKNTAAALAWYNKAILLGHTPLLEDSDGRGSYKLWILFESPVPTAKARTFGLSLTRDWSKQGLPTQPEVFPKQSRLSGKRSGGWVRLPGRHHTRNHWSQFWAGDRWLDGEEAVNLLVSAIGGPPPAIDASDRSRDSDEAERDDDQHGTPIETIRSALAALPAEFRDEYGNWISVGMSLRELGDLGFELWEAWSRPSAKFQEGECRRKWETFSPGGGLRTRHLLDRAEEHGWQGSGEATDESLGDAADAGDADGGDGADERDEDGADTGPEPIAWLSKPFERITAAVYRAARRIEPEVFQHGGHTRPPSSSTARRRPGDRTAFAGRIPRLARQDREVADSGEARIRPNAAAGDGRPAPDEPAGGGIRVRSRSSSG